MSERLGHRVIAAILSMLAVVHWQCSYHDSGRPQVNDGSHIAVADANETHIALATTATPFGDVHVSLEDITTSSGQVRHGHHELVFRNETGAVITSVVVGNALQADGSAIIIDAAARLDLGKSNTVMRLITDGYSPLSARHHFCRNAVATTRSLGSIITESSHDCAKALSAFTTSPLGAGALRERINGRCDSWDVEPVDPFDLIIHTSIDGHDGTSGRESWECLVTINLTTRTDDAHSAHTLVALVRGEGIDPDLCEIREWDVDDASETQLAKPDHGS